MKAVIVFCMLGLALGSDLPQEDPIQKEIFGYHTNIGMKLAEEIKARETMDLSGGNRITGGSHATLGQFPHMGGLLIQVPLGTSVCGSSLLSNTRILTAAHCWYDGSNRASQFTVILGSTTLFTGGTRIITSDVTMHELWRPWLMWLGSSAWIHNDVAVATIPWVTYSNTIAPIALPSGDLLTNTLAGWDATAVGFGRTGDSILDGIGSNQPLSHVNVQVIANTACQAVFGGAVIDSTICIDGSDRQSTCGGDSGGPLQVTSGGQSVLVGVTSFGHSRGCAQGFPAAFARVSAFVPWIRERL